ncbi:hypothetical protein [Paenibacillus ginsengarvi]|uniref:hypothetical protein n=1 Tax=Paenibacillus ginsengarvi TaxID=400777 RepID=UPI0011C4344D|nr:hypothetical protein [Paenibacillus ginsengarvi]
MSEKKEYNYESARTVIQQLSEHAGDGCGELLQWIDELESREAGDRAYTERLAAENERLKRELVKLRAAQAGIMSSRLKDALRE